jgi:D-alanine-D-alanine ligase
VIKIGIFFGGNSREREISFAGGRTVYDNLDKTLFEAVPLFVDSVGNLILLDWQYIYKGTIRDFYPPMQFLPNTADPYQVYIESLGALSPEQLNNIIAEVGKPVQWAELKGLIDFAFLTLHGFFGEDGQIQGLFESLQIPYSGSGIRACSIGMDKSFQKKMMEAGGFNTPDMVIFNRKNWTEDENSEEDWYDNLAKQIGFPMVVRPSNQGSSIGVTIVNDNDGLEVVDAINAAFFIKILERETWLNLDHEGRVHLLREITDIRSGIGFPLRETLSKSPVMNHPAELLQFLNEFFEDVENDFATLESQQSEQTVIIESFIKGREFSCIVIRDEAGRAIALPPTEIVKGGELFDYRSKYLAGLSRKETPIRIDDEQIERIRTECERLFEFFGFACYARIDGFIKEDGRIFLNDPNTTSGMLPSSFFFHQSAEIGLNPSQFLTYIIRTSIAERIKESTQLWLYDNLLKRLDENLVAQQSNKVSKMKVAVILGGYSSERHISVESGRNIYEKLSSSDKYEPVPVFLSKDEQDELHIWQIPINILLKDNADDIHDKIKQFKKHPIIEKIKLQCAPITQKYVHTGLVFEPIEWTFEDLKEQVQAVFIALHGRPGEDGKLQEILEQHQIPYNGSQSFSAQITINKYETLQTLKKEGFVVTNQALVYKTEFESDANAALDKVEAQIRYPLIAKPMDDGCSSAVKKIKTRQQLQAFLSMLFRADETQFPEAESKILSLKPKEEFPTKEVALIEQLIDSNGAEHFLEITGGLLTHYNQDGSLRYEMFEPSEALASGEVLSLEEKFLAGEGQNITPARYTKAPNLEAHKLISKQVQATLQRAAEVLKVTGYARIDAFVRVFPNNRAETIIVEVNSLPGMTPATCIFHQCAINQYKPYQFIDQILSFGITRSKDKTTRNSF